MDFPSDVSIILQPSVDVNHYLLNAGKKNHQSVHDNDDDVILGMVVVSCDDGCEYRN